MKRVLFFAGGMLLTVSVPAFAQNALAELCQSMVNVGFIEKQDSDTYISQIRDEYDSFCSSEESTQSKSGNASLGFKKITASGGRSFSNASKKEFCSIERNDLDSQLKDRFAQSSGTAVLEQANECGKLLAQAGTEVIYAAIDVMESDEKFTVTMNYFKPERAAERRFTLISIEGDEISCTQAGNDVRGTLVVRTVGEQPFTCTKNKNQNVIAHLNFKADDTAEARRSIPIRASSRNVERERQDAINREVARISNDLELRMQAMINDIKASTDKISGDVQNITSQINSKNNEFHPDSKWENETKRCPPGSYMVGISYNMRSGGNQGMVSRASPVCRKFFAQ